MFLCSTKHQVIPPNYYTSTSKETQKWALMVKVLEKNYPGRKLTGKQVFLKYGDGLSQYSLCDRHEATARYASDARSSHFKNNSFLSGPNSNNFLKAEGIFTSY